MEELRDAFGDVLTRRRDKGLFVEVALIEGVNDGQEHAEALADLLRPLPGKTRINLLPYNPFAPDAATLPRGLASASFKTPSVERVRRFQEAIMQHGYVCTLRTARGAEKAAACGQLVSAVSMATSKELG